MKQKPHRSRWGSSLIRFDEDKQGEIQDRAFDWESAVRPVERKGKKSKVIVIFMGDKFDEGMFKL